MFRLLRTVIATGDVVIMYSFFFLVTIFVFWNRLGDASAAGNVAKLVMDAAVLCIAAGVLVRSATQDRFIRRGLFRERVFVLGAGERAQCLVRQLESRPDLGMDVVGCAGRAEGLSEMYQVDGELRSIDAIVVSMPDRRGQMPVNELLKFRLAGLNIVDGASLLERISGKVEVDDFLPSSWIFDGNLGPAHYSLVVRRAVSFLVSLVAILVLLPIIPILALAIKLTSPGPVLYRQIRCGKNGVPFTCFKFRTMYSNAEAESGPVWASAEDPRITMVGRFLRKIRLDEIPQLWNVLRGDMELIGPRPERPEFVEHLTHDISYYSMRHIIPPGVTGWAQTHYKYGNSQADAKEKLKYDLYYIKNMSFYLDMVILYKTVKTIISGQGAH